MTNFCHRLLASCAGGFLLASAAAAQAPATAAAAASAPAVEQAIELAAKGRCHEALPQLKKSMSRITDKDLKYRAAMATAKCAMSLDQTDSALQALLLLNREFPNDPEVLYITTHYHSQLASRASQHLASAAPSSYQAHELEAEALESQGKWDEAATEYKGILARNPDVPGIHYRLGRVALAKSDTPAGGEEAKKEFEAELKLDPTNAASEFWLGEIARRSGEWDAATPHFARAAQLDPGFAEAYLALGMTLNAAQKFPEAVAPLESYVKMVPEDTAGHYQLAIAYARTNRKEDATREMGVQRQLTEKNSGAKARPNGAASQQ
jgi:tetratricopeptide (TPR) repeat protein